MSAPFMINLTEHGRPDSSQTTATPQTAYSAFPDDNVEPYTHLLAACYRTNEDDLAVPNTSAEYLSNELGVERLNNIHQWLWLVGRPMPPRALHHQKLLGREVVLTERMDMHLTWTGSRIFLKPLPRFLLDSQFWVQHLSCRGGCKCSNSSLKRPEISRNCEQYRLRRCALGFLMSFTALVSYESDFHMAQELHLLPRHVSWPAWKGLVREVLQDRLIYRHINKRYIYGELRLNRLNMIYRLARGSIRGYQPEYSHYGGFFQDNFTWLASLLAYVVIVLAVMQVGLGTRVLRENDAFQAVSYGFAVFPIVSSAAVVALIFVLFFILLIYNWIRTVQYEKKRFGKLDLLED